MKLFVLIILIFFTSVMAQTWKTGKIGEKHTTVNEKDTEVISSTLVVYGKNESKKWPKNTAQRKKFVSQLEATTCKDYNFKFNHMIPTQSEYSFVFIEPTKMEFLMVNISTFDDCMKFQDFTDEEYETYKKIKQY